MKILILVEYKLLIFFFIVIILFPISLSTKFASGRNSFKLKIFWHNTDDDTTKYDVISNCLNLSYFKLCPAFKLYLTAR